MGKRREAHDQVRVPQLTESLCNIHQPHYPALPAPCVYCVYQTNPQRSALDFSLLHFLELFHPMASNTASRLVTGKMTCSLVSKLSSPIVMCYHR